MTPQERDQPKLLEARRRWPAELLVFRAATRGQLLEEMERSRRFLTCNARTELAQLAAACWQRACRRLSDAHATGGADWLPTVAIVAGTATEAAEKLRQACMLVAQAEGSATNDARLPPSEGDPGLSRRPAGRQGIYFAEERLLPDGKLAVLFPGQGVQQPGMFAALAAVFPQLNDSLCQADRLLEGRCETPLYQYVCDARRMKPEKRRRWAELFRRSELALPLTAAACLGMFRLLSWLGLKPDMLAGHSFGEHVALCAAGAMSYDDLILLAYRRGVALTDAAAACPGGMLAVAADADTCRRLLAGCNDVAIANVNAPRQVVISGTEEALAQAQRVFDANRIATERLGVAGPFHCALMSGARKAIADSLQRCRIGSTAVPVWSNITAGPMPNDPAQVAQILLEHTTAPVRFAEQIENMYAAGARVFVEVGPRNVLCRLVGRILRGRLHLAVATHSSGQNELVQLQHALGQLLVGGTQLRLEYLYELRGLGTGPTACDNR